MIDSLNDFKKDMFDFWKNDLFQGSPELAMDDFNSLTMEAWNEMYISHIEQKIESLNYDLTIDLRWLYPRERIEKTRDLKTYKARLKTLKSGVK